jgi:hypothetical protein
MYRPSASTIDSSLPWNLGDPALNTWILGWEYHALINDPGRFFDGNIFFPYGEAIKYSEMMLPVVPVFGLAWALSASAIVAHNIAILMLAIFCLCATFILSRRLIGPEAAVAAAITFSFSGYVFMHQGHLQLLTLGFFPLGYFALFRALESQRVRDGVWLGVCTVLLTLASFYYGAIWLICLCACVLIDWFRLKKPGRRWWGTILAAALVSVVVLGPIAYVYAEFQSRVPFERAVGGLGLNPIDFVTPAPGSLIYGNLFAWASERQPTGIVEHGLFGGFVVLALAALGGIRYGVGRRKSGPASRARYELGLLIASGAVSLVFALGPEVMGMPMPYRLLSEFVPPFDSIRAVSRLAVPGLLGLAVVAGYGLRWIVRRLSTEQSVAIVALVSSLIMLEMWVQPLRAEVGPSSAIRDHLADMPPGAVLELPMRTTGDPAFAFVEGPRLLDTVGDWRPRFNGFSGGFPPGYLEVTARIMTFPEEASLGSIEDLGIRYVVLHGSPEGSDSSFAFERIGEMLSGVPEDAVVLREADAWLVDLGPPNDS